MYYYQRSRRKNRQHQNEELKNEAERLPNSRSQSAHLTDEQVEQVLSAIRAAKSSTDLSSRSTTTTTDSMRSRSSSRPPPPSTPPPPLPKSKINQDVVRDDRQHVPTKPKFDEEMQKNSKVKNESAPKYYGSSSSSTTMRSRSSSRPPPPSTPPPPLPKFKKSPKTIATTSTKSKEIPKNPNHNLHSNYPKINDSSTEINMDITTNGCSNESLSSSTSLLSSSPKLAPNLKNDDTNANDSDDDDEPFEWVDNPTYDEKEDEDDENSEWSHNPTYSNPSDQEIKINFNEEDFNEENINIIPPISSVPSTPKVSVFQKIFHLLF